MSASAAGIIQSKACLVWNNKSFLKKQQDEFRSYFRERYRSSPMDKPVRIRTSAETCPNFLKTSLKRVFMIRKDIMQANETTNLVCYAWCLQQQDSRLFQKP